LNLNLDDTRGEIIMALTEEELNEIDGEFKELVESSEELVENVKKLRAKLKREEKDTEE